jgi:DNA-binding LacI/PurR family transcriptional regulator
LGLITGETPGVMTIICDDIARFAHVEGMGVLLGKWPITAPDEIVHRTEELGEQYIARKVAGVFFTPMHVPHEQMPINAHIAEAFDRAGIPVVLLDRDIYDYPRRSNFDLVGIDNVHAGYVLTAHLLSLGYRRIGFVASAATASTVTARVAGYREALLQHGITPVPEWIHRGDTSQVDFVRGLMEDSRPDALVCANDFEAAKIMRRLSALGVRVPEDVAIVGVNDDPYAKVVSVPLTTLRQPCSDIAAAAVRLMLQRLRDRNQAVREVRLNCELIIRESCGVAIRSRDATMVG